MPLTPEQLKMRAEAYGASEVATVVHVGPGKMIDLYQSKRDPANAVGGPVEPEEENLLADLGHLLEEPVAQVYAKRTKTFLVPVATLRHPTLPLAIATPDRARFLSQETFVEAVRLAGRMMLGAEHLELADRLVEVKTTGNRYRRDYGPAGTGQVPEEKAIQATWQMGVSGHRVVDMPVLFRGEWGAKLEVFTVTFNADLFAWLYDEVERFHRDYVLAGRPPPPDGSDAYDEAQARIYPGNRRPAIVADEDDEALMMRFAKFREVYRRADHFKKIAAQDLKNRIGEADGMISPVLGKVSWTRSKDSTEVDWEKAAQDALMLAGQCLNAFDHLRDVGEHISPENRASLEARLKEIVPQATRVKSGHRSLRPYFKGDAALELMRLNIAMDALESGE